MEQVLSKNIELKDSQIHHKGVFAARDIKKGTKIIEYIGKKVNKEEAEKIFQENYEKHRKNKNKGAVYLFELNKKYDIDGDIPENLAKYVNHSCNPNCESDIISRRIWYIALKDIKKGEELTLNYGYDIDVCLDHPCKCGSKNCKKYILAEEDWPKLKKLLK